MGTVGLFILASMFVATASSAAEKQRQHLPSGLGIRLTEEEFRSRIQYIQNHSAEITSALRTAVWPAGSQHRRGAVKYHSDTTPVETPEVGHLQAGAVEWPAPASNDYSGRKLHEASYVGVPAECIGSFGRILTTECCGAYAEIVAVSRHNATCHSQLPMFVNVSTSVPISEEAVVAMCDTQNGCFKDLRPILARFKATVGRGCANFHASLGFHGDLLCSRAQAETQSSSNVAVQPVGGMPVVSVYPAEWCYPVLQRLLFVGRGLVAAHAMNTRYTPPAVELVEGLCGPCLAIIVDAVSHRLSAVEAQSATEAAATATSRPLNFVLVLSRHVCLRHPIDGKRCILHEDFTRMHTPWDDMNALCGWCARPMLDLMILYEDVYLLPFAAGHRFNFQSMAEYGCANNKIGRYCISSFVEAEGFNSFFQSLAVCTAVVLGLSSVCSPVCADALRLMLSNLGCCTIGFVTLTGPLYGVYQQDVLLSVTKMLQLRCGVQFPQHCHNEQGAVVAFSTQGLVWPPSVSPSLASTASFALQRDLIHNTGLGTFAFSTGDMEFQSTSTGQGLEIRLRVMGNTVREGYEFQHKLHQMITRDTFAMPNMLKVAQAFSMLSPHRYNTLTATVGGHAVVTTSGSQFTSTSHFEDCGEEYTIEEGCPRTDEDDSQGMALGLVLGATGGVLALALVVGSAVWFCRYRRRTKLAEAPSGMNVSMAHQLQVAKHTHGEAAMVYRYVTYSK